MPGPPLAFDELLRQLAGVRTTGGKIRLLARYWGELQRLSSAERERLALALGSKLAWGRLEKLFGRDGKLLKEELLVKQALDRLGSSDPGELKKVARSLREGDAGPLRRQVLGVVEEALQPEGVEGETGLASQEAGPEPVGGPEPAPAAEALPPPPPPVSETEAPGPPGSAAAAGAAVAAGVAVGSGAAPGGSAAAGEPAPEARPPQIEEPPPRSVEASRPQPEEPPSEPEGRRRAVPGRPPEARRRDAAVERKPAPAESLAVAAGPVAAVSERAPLGPEETPEGRGLPPAARLALLRGLAAGRIPRDRRGRARLFADLGAGWAARRGLSELIRRRALADLDEALGLIARLPSQSQRLWCLGDLVAHWPLDAGGRERVLAAAPTERSRGRLALRAASQRARSTASGRMAGGAKR